LRWIGRNERGLQVAIGVLAAGVFLTRNQPSPGTVLTIVLVTAVLLGLLSVLARTGRADGEAGSDGDADEPDAVEPDADDESADAEPESVT
jgi:hypothetical protein